MEKSDLRDFSKITKLFSNFIIQNKIPTENYLESFNQAFFNLAKTQKLGDLKELVSLYHYINKHQNSDLKLECNISHCIECYFDIVNDENYLRNQTMCSCNRIIAVNFRKKIIENFERIQKLKEVCIVCGHKQDLMNFIVKKTHECLVCSSCIQEAFEYKNKRNTCRQCRQEYNEESDQSIRQIIEVNIPEDIIKQHYLAKCPQCGNDKDRREFVQTCNENKCLACKNCILDKTKSKDTNCFCDGLLTIIQ